MALNKAIATQFGDDIFANYWLIANVAEDFIGKSIEVTFHGYSSESARKSGKKMMATAALKIDGNDYVVDATRSDLYSLLKHNPAFENAVDC